LPSRKRPEVGPSSRSSAEAPEGGLPLTPALVVLGSRDEESARGLRANVTRRLVAHAETGALRWVGPFPSGHTVTGAELAQACEPLLSWDLWQRLGGRETGSPVPIRVILVVDRMGGKPDGPPPEALLEALKEMRGLLEGRADLAPVLIWLGEKPNPPPKGLNLCWPRIRMERLAAGGIRADPPLVWGATEHLLVALAGSALIPAINQSVQKEKTEWLVAGASALLMHPRLEEWVREAVLEKVLAPLITPLKETDKDRIESAMGRQAQAIRDALREEAVAALRETGWEIETEPEGPAVRRCVLKDDALLEALFGPYREGVISWKPDARGWREWPGRFLNMLSALAEPFLPEQDLGEKLHRHYRELRERLEQWLGAGRWRGLAPRALEKYRDLSILLGAFLDRGLLSGLPSEKRPSWWFTEPSLPTGLPALLRALFSLEKHLCEEGDIRDARGGAQAAGEWVRPDPLGTEAYLQAAGEADAAIVRGNLLRYAHFARTLASPWGVLLYLLPAWPLGAFLLQAFVHWEPAQAYLVTGIALLIIGLAELAYWWLLKARRLLKAVQQDAYHYLSGRILQLTAGALRDYRHWILSRLREADLALADLYAVCLRRHAEAEKAAMALEKFSPQENGNTFFLLMERERLQRWQDEALREIHGYQRWKDEALQKIRSYLGEHEIEEFDSAVTALIARHVWPLTEQPLPGREVLQELERVCEEKVKETAPSSQEWRAGIAAEEVESLKGGRRWEWLWNHAHPLGRVESPASELTFLMAAEEMLSGRTGTGSRYWKSDWQIVPTLQREEEMCVRVLVEPQRGA